MWSSGSGGKSADDTSPDGFHHLSSYSFHPFMYLWADNADTHCKSAQHARGVAASCLRRPRTSIPSEARLSRS